MYAHFDYKDGSNPYITTTNAAFLSMWMKYDIEWEDNGMFVVNGPVQWVNYRAQKITGREKAKTVLREIAYQWQYMHDEFDFTWSNYCEWQEFFEEQGRKYGLLREFRENGIC